MKTFWLHLRAPFAAFRSLHGGSYRASSRSLPPSAAYGLILGLAGVELRPAEPGTPAASAELPALRLALGQLQAPGVAVLFQQLHGGGGPGKARISPARREFLVDFEAVLAVQAGAALADQVLAALAGRPAPGRYGLPFAGDNNLLFDHIRGSSAAMAARWLTPLALDQAPRPGSERLTVWIDRADSARTRHLLMAPAAELREHPPPEAWLEYPGGITGRDPAWAASGSGP